MYAARVLFTRVRDITASTDFEFNVDDRNDPASASLDEARQP